MANDVLLDERYRLDRRLDRGRTTDVRSGEDRRYRATVVATAAVMATATAEAARLRAPPIEYKP